MPSFDQHLNRPPIQAALIFGSGFAIMLVGWLLGKAHIMTPDPLFPWSIAAAFMLLFALVNSLLSLRADSFTKYWGVSMYSYMGLAFCNALVAWLFSGISIGNAGSYRWIYIVVTIGFIVFLTLVNTVRRIVEFAEREEWNEPRKRR